MVHKIRGKQIF